MQMFRSIHWEPVFLSAVCNEESTPSNDLFPDLREIDI